MIFPKIQFAFESKNLVTCQNILSGALQRLEKQVHMMKNVY
jgi:hypothetical protein